MVDSSEHTAENFAGRGFRTGELIMECEPWVWSLEWDNQSVFCAYCLKRTSDLKTCTQCHTYRYCGEDCQKLDWKKEHKLECFLLKGISYYRTEISRSISKFEMNSLFTVEVLMLIKMMNKIYVRCCDLTRFPFNWPLKERRQLFEKEFGHACSCRKCTP
ncbi:uncharacterized protein LOC129585353 [Paramacrobiotus metropolitanus]|uniref:uncharacterized protein LOC129585353 n=1 Tax=Paramacrobiotus metropolitanus TaxID=2943436 RepID=UPI002445FA76|nr:uncharacterized protein LOC129585353 [Paramacrobiotus metropolitanus]